MYIVMVLGTVVLGPFVIGIKFATKIIFLFETILCKIRFFSHGYHNGFYFLLFIGFFIVTVVRTLGVIIWVLFIVTSLFTVLYIISTLAMYDLLRLF